jgi:hypothetical protein
MNAILVRIPNPFDDADAVDDAVEAARSVPAWPMSPSPFDYQVMVYGGDDPRTGLSQLPQVFQFFKRRWSTGYTLEGVIARAEDMAERQHRSHFAVRDTDGSVVHVGQCRLWAARQVDLAKLDRGLRRFKRSGL